MTDRINLEGYAENIIADSIYGMNTLDMDKLREEADERVGQDADSACTYYYQHAQILQDYEAEAYKIGDPDDLIGDRTYKASEWEEARQACAYAVAYTILQARTADNLQAVEEAASNLCDEIGARGDLGEDVSVDLDDLRVSTSCPHGWAAHDYEDSDGMHFWVSRQLDGCNAIAIEAGGIWLSYTWTPVAPSESAT